METKLIELLATNPMQINSWSDERSGKICSMNIDNEFEVEFFASEDSRKYESSDTLLPSYYTTKTCVIVVSVTAEDMEGTVVNLSPKAESLLEDYIYKNLRQ